MDTAPPMLIRPKRRAKVGTGADPDAYFAAMKMSGVATVLTDPNRPDNPIVFANDAFSNLTGFAPDDVIGRNCRFLQASPPDPATIDTLRRALAARRRVSVEMLNRKRDGTLFWNALSIGPVFDAAGHLRHFIGNQVDVSTQRAAEQALRQMQKMEAIGQLTGGVAHDFNNLLTVILASVEALRRDNLPEERRIRSIDAIHSTASRAAKLTGQLLAFARKEPVQTIIFDASEQVRRTVDMLRTIVGSRIKIITDLPSDRCFIRGDISQFETALVNIAVNGRDAMHGQGHLTITVRRISGIAASPGPSASNGDVVVVAVTDTGEGIPADSLERIFEPLFTTKEKGAGTGLGLSQVYGFVKQTGGEVRVESEVDRGTTVSLNLPYCEIEPSPGSAELNRQSPRGSERLLMVEHHMQITEITSEILRDLGYAVQCVTHAEAALEALASDERGFSLVFSDVQIPGPMSGVDLAQTLNRRWPGLPVLLTTGDSNVLAKQDEMSDKFRVLRKPYSAEALTSVIHDRCIAARGDNPGMTGFALTVQMV